MSGLTASAMTGLGKVFLQNEDVEFHITPVDFTANIAITAASVTTPSDISFYNSTISSSNPFTFKDLKTFFHKDCNQVPPYENLFWFPRYQVESNILFFTLKVALMQFIPAIIFDIFCLMCNKKAL
jgi:hypothetical protein